MTSLGDRIKSRVFLVKRDPTLNPHHTRPSWSQQLAYCQCSMYIAGEWWSPCVPVVQRTNTLWTALWGKYRMNWTQLGICIKAPHQRSQLLWHNARALPWSPKGMLFEMSLVFIFWTLPHTTSGFGTGFRVATLPYFLWRVKGCGNKSNWCQYLGSKNNLSLNC